MCLIVLKVQVRIFQVKFNYYLKVVNKKIFYMVINFNIINMLNS